MKTLILAALAVISLSVGTPNAQCNQHQQNYNWLAGGD
jgi:hypothetical protein